MKHLGLKFPTNLVLICWFACCFSCNNHDKNGKPELAFATAEDFADSASVAVELDPAFQLTLWAPGPLLSNAVAISIDNQGVAYVSETQRRKSSDLDIRAHRDWMTEDLSLQSLDDTRKFHQQKLSRANSDQNQWLEDFNQDGFHDWQDLTVQSEYIRKIWDSNGDGRADVSSLFAADINDMITGVAAGVLSWDNTVYLTAAPDVYRFNDYDQDGDADHREIISHGFGVHIAYAGHDMSGLAIGPDGKIYWSVGDIGVDASSKEGIHYSYPNQGAVMRANPDGSDFEVFARGLRNPQELAFDAYGNLISVDNDGDHPGEHERFVHILEGSDSGWRINWQFGKYQQENEEYKVWMDEKLYIPHFPGQAAYLLPPLALAPDGPAGLVYQPGSALNEQWNNFFFGSYFKGSAAQSKIQAFRLAPKGASFELADTKDILTGIVSTGLAFGPDGALYLNDWLEGYEKKPAGRIWKLDVKNKNSDERSRTRELLANGTKETGEQDLEQQLNHPDMRVRLAAQFELVDRKKSDALLSVLENNEDNIAGIHSIWGLGQLSRINEQYAAGLLPYLDSQNPEIRAQTAKVLGDARYSEASDKLLGLLDDDNDRVVYFAAEALGKLEESRAFQPLVGLMTEIKDTDPHLRHGLVYALSRLASEQELADLSTHSAVDARLGAVVALRYQRSAGLAHFLNDSDSLVLMEAARAINDDQSVPDALPALAESLMNHTTANEVFVRRAINANLRLGDQESAVRLAQYANDVNAPAAMRSDALWALGYWPKPPVLDRVDGRYRELSERKLESAQTAFSAVADELLQTKNYEVQTAAIKLVGRLKYMKEESRLIEFFTNKTQPLIIRRAALKSLAQLESNKMEEIMKLALEDRHIELRTDAQTLLGESDFPPETVVSLLNQVLDNSTISERQKALNSLGKIDHPAASDVLRNWLQKLLDGTLEESLQLDVIMAVESSTFDSLKELLLAYEEARKDEPALVRYREALFGGDPRKGRRIFLRNNSAQCIRCHILGPVGGEVGPDLSKIATLMSRESLLEAMVDPSARLAPGYGTVSLGLSDNEKIVGVLISESDDSVAVRNSEGTISSFALADLQSVDYMPSSMPTMEGVLSKQEIRDLVSFLVTLK